MGIAVVICSHNGARLLERSIAAVQRSLTASDGGELLLVDSASTDRTSEIMARSGRRVTRVGERGLSLARNVGWMVATDRGHRGVLFTDDDVIVPENWVRAMSAPLLDGYAAVAGEVHVADEFATDLSHRQREFLADTRYMNLGGDPPRTMVGASFGVSCRLYRLGFRFDTRLGPGSLGFMEETLLHMQITEAGGQTKHVESAPVLHRIDAARLTATEWRDRAKRQGRCEAWVSRNWLHETQGHQGWKRYLRAEARVARGTDDLDTVRHVANGRWRLAHALTPRKYTKRAVPSRLR